MTVIPDDARYLVENVGAKTKITGAISSEFAFAKLGGVVERELEVYVEDEVARTLLLSALPSSIRTRIDIKVIGSATAIARQLAALYVRGSDRNTLAVFDGDQRAKEADNIGHARSMAENNTGKFDDWIKTRVAYLPGSSWPEAWIIQKCVETPDPVAALLGLEVDELQAILEYGLQAGKHNEFFEIARHLGLDRTHCLQQIATAVCSAFSGEFEGLTNTIAAVLQ